MSDIQTIPLVSINVIKTKLHGIDNQRLVEEISNTRGEIDPKYMEDKHHTYYEDKRYPFGMPEAEKLIIELSKTVCSILGKEMELSEIWTLTLGEGQSVAAHSHKSNTYMQQEEYFSIAYYPSAPENSADLIFMGTACNTIETSVTISPHVGDLIIFNSYLMHMTNRHRNKNEKRIVVSANFVPKYPNVRPSQDWSAYARNTQPISKTYINAYRLVAQTVFGEEEYFLYEITPGDWSIEFNGKSVEIENMQITDTKMNASFSTNTPMTVNILFDFDIFPDKSLFGSVKIGDFMTLKTVGMRI